MAKDSKDSNNSDDGIVYIAEKDEFDSDEEEDKMELISHVRKMIHGSLTVGFYII